MADDTDFSRPANDAMSRLDDFRAQNPFRISALQEGYSPSPSPGFPSPTTSVPHRWPPIPTVPAFQPSRMVIPSTAYAPAYTAAQYAPPKSPGPLTGHMPVIRTHSPSPEPSLSKPYEPQVYREPLECLTRQMVYDRVYIILRDNLTEWWAKNLEALHLVVQDLSNYLIDLGVKGVYGPNGLSSLYQICMCFGREGIYSYMCLAVQSDYGGFTPILQGDLCEKEGKDPLHSEEMMGLVKDGFDKSAAKLYATIVTAAPRA